MSYTSVKLRGIDCDIAYRVIEDDPSTNAFESEWHFTDPPPFADSLTDEEETLISTTISEAAWHSDDGGPDE